MKRFLVVIDMQHDFIDGSLGTWEAQQIIPAAAARIRALVAQGYECIATMDTHFGNYLNTQEGRRLPVVHCAEGTSGWQIHETIREAMGECRCILKSAFGSTELPGYIARRADGQETEIELMGLCTDICVVSNALLLKSFLPEAHIRVNSGCCAGVTPDRHRAALETMASCQIEII